VGQHLIWRCPSPQGADVTVFERPLGPEGDLDRLFAVGGHRGATVGNLGEVDDPEEYLGFYLSRAGSRTGTFGEPDITVCEPSCVR